MRAAKSDASKAPYRVFSFGAGVQSITLLYAWVFDSILMRREPGGEQWDGFFNGETPDLIAFADTKAESPEVYAAVEDARELCKEAGVPFIVVSAGDLAHPPKSSTGVQGIYVPVYTLKLHTDEDGPAGQEGQLRRQCTSRYKIEPVMRAASRFAGDRPIEVSLAISLEEAHRMKRRDAGDQIQNRYPLVLQSALGGMTRNDCINFLRDLDVPAAKSACYFCPYKADYRWLQMYRDEPELFAKAVEYDEWVRDQRPGYKCYLHRSRRPLAIVVSELANVAEQQTGLFPIDLSTAESGGCEEGYCEG